MLECIGIIHDVRIFTILFDRFRFSLRAIETLLSIGTDSPQTLSFSLLLFSSYFNSYNKKKKINSPFIQKKKKKNLSIE